MPKEFNIAAALSVSAPRNLDSIAQRIQTGLSGIKAQVDVQVSPEGRARLLAMNAALAQAQQNLRQTSQAAAATGGAFSALGTSATKAAGEIGVLNASFNVSFSQRYSQATREASGATDELSRSTVGATRNLFGMGLAAGAAYRAVGALSAGVREAARFERGLISVQQASGATSADIAELTGDISRLSVGLGVSSRDLLGVASTLNRAGTSIEQTRQLLAVIGQASLTPGFEDMRRSAEGALGIMATFGHSARDLSRDLSSISVVSRQYATSADEITDAVRRSGAVFRAAGGDLNEFLALFGSVRSATRESSESIATGLRTIFARIQRGGNIEALHQMGVNLRYTAQEAERLGRTDLTNQFVGPIEAVRRLHAALDGLPTTDARFAAITERLGGFRQVQTMIPLLTNVAEAQRAYNLAMFGSVPISQTATQAQDALLVRVTSLRERFLDLTRNLTQDTAFRSFASAALTVAESLIKVTDALRPVLPMLAGLAAIRIGQFAGNLLAGQVSALSGAYQTSLGRGPTRFARGGVVPGSGNTDSEPALLMPGEFIIRKQAAQSIGYGRLNAMNSGTQRYANGGEVHLKPGVRIGQLFLEGREGNDVIGVSPERSAKFLSAVQAATGLKRDDARLIAGKFRLKDNVDEHRLDENKLAPIFRTQVAPRITDAINSTLNAYVPDGVRGYSVDFNDNKRAVATVEGLLFEKFVSVLTGVNAAANNEPFDFSPSKRQLKRFGGLFNPQPVVAQYLDAKRTRQAPSKILSKALTQGIFDFAPDNVAYAKQLAANISVLHQEQITAIEQKLAALKSGTPQKKALGGLVHFDRGGAVSLSAVSKGNIAAMESFLRDLGLPPIRVGNLVRRLYATTGPFPAKLGGDRTLGVFETHSGAAMLRADSSIPLGEIAAHEILGHAADFRAAGSQDFASLDARTVQARVALKGAPLVYGHLLSSEATTHYQSKGGETLLKESLAFSVQAAIRSLMARRGLLSLGSQERRLFGSRDTRQLFAQIADELIPEIARVSRMPLPISMDNSANYVDRLVRHGAPTIGRFAAGGASGRDTVPALLTPGEYVLNRDAVARIGMANLHRMNAVGQVQGFNRGGAVRRFANGTDEPIPGLASSDEWTIIGGHLYHRADNDINIRPTRQDRRRQRVEPFRVLYDDRRTPNYRGGVPLSETSVDPRLVIPFAPEPTRPIGWPMPVASGPYQYRAAQEQVALTGLTNQRRTGAAIVNAEQGLAHAMQAEALVHEQLTAGIRKQLLTLDKGISVAEAETTARQMATTAIQENERLLIQQGRVVGTAALGARLNAAGLTAGGAATAGLGRRLLGGIGNNFGHVAFAASAIAPVAIDRAFGRFDATASDEHNRRAVAGEQISGAITGASTGALLGGSIGAAFGGIGAPVGAAIGAVGGGIYGYIGAGREGGNHLEENRFDRMAQRINTSLSAIASTNGALNASEVARSVRGVEDLLEGAAERGRRRFAESGSTNTADLLRQLRESQQQALQSALPAITRIMTSETERLARQGNIRGADQLLNQFRSSAVGSQAFRAISVGTDRPVEEVERNFRQLAETTLRQVTAARAGAESQNRLNSMLLNFDGLTKAVQGAATAMQPFETQIASLSATFNGQLARVNTVSLVPHLQNIGGPSGQYLNAVGQLTSFFGNDLRAPLRAQAGSADALQRLLPDILERAASRSTLGQHESADAFILSQLRDNRSILPEHVDIVAGRLAQLANQEGPGGLSEQLRNPGVLGRHLTQEIVEPQSRFFSETARIVETQANGLVSALVRQQEGLRRVYSEQAKLEENRLSVLRFQAARVAEFAGRESTRGLDLLSTAQLQRPVTANLENLTGLRGTAALDPSAVGHAFDQVFRASQEALRRQQGTSVDLNPGSAFSRASQDYVELHGRAVRLQEALQRLADASELNAAVQEKLSRVDQERSDRLSLGERLLRGGSVATAQFTQGAALARFANAQGHVANFAPQQVNMLLNFLETVRNVRLPGLGGITGEDLRTNLIHNTLPGIASLPQGREAERQGLLNQVGENLNRAAEAQQRLVQVQHQLQDEFFSRTGALNASFLANLRAALLEGRQSQLQVRHGELSAQLGQARTRHDQASLLTSAGITDENLARFRSDQASTAINRYVEAISAERSLSAASERLFARRNQAQFFTAQTPQIFDRPSALARELFGARSTVNPAFFTRAQSIVRDQFGIGTNLLDDTALNRVLRGAISDYNHPGRMVQNNEEFVQAIARHLQTEIGQLAQRRIEAGTAVGTATGATGRTLDQVLGRLNNTHDRTEFLNALRNVTSIADAARNLANIEQRLRESSTALQTIAQNMRHASGHAAGGAIVSFRPHGTDTVPAMLTPGEFVVRREMAARYGPQLRAINAGRFANGGQVPGQSIHGLLTNLDDQQLARLYDRSRQFGVQAIYGQLGTFSSIANNRRAGANLQRGALASLQAMMGAVSNNVEDRQGRIAYLEHLPPQAQQALLAYHTRVSQVFAGFDGMGLPQLQQYYMRRIIPRLNVWLPQVLRRIEANQRLVDRNPNNRQAERMLTILTKYRDFYEGFPLQLSEVIGFHGAQGEQELRDYVKRFNIGPALGDLWRPEMPAAGGVLAPVIPTLGQLQDNLSRADNRTGAVVTASPRAPRPRAAFTSGVGVGGRVVDVIGNTNRLEGFAHGGYVHHGHGRVDDVHARLTQGEYVLNRDAVASLGKNNLDYLNQHGPRFAQGGYVGRYAGGGSVGAAGNLAAGVPDFSRLTAAMTAFNGASATLANSFHVFAGNATALTKAIEAMPHTITMHTQGRIDVVLSGAEALQSIQPAMQAYVNATISEKLRDLMKDKFRDAGPFSV